MIPSIIGYYQVTKINIMVQFDQMPQLNNTPTNKSLEEETLQKAAETLGEQFANRVHSFFEAAVNKYNQEYPNDIHSVPALAEFIPRIHISKGMVEFQSKNITLILVKKNTKWEIGELKYEMLTSPAKVADEIRSEFQTYKSGFAELFNNILESTL